jgi:hypothetical protein
MATKIFWLGSKPEMLPEFNAELNALFTDGYEVKIANNVMIVLYRDEFVDYNQSRPVIENNGKVYRHDKKRGGYWEITPEQIQETFGVSVREFLIQHGVESVNDGT